MRYRTLICLAGLLFFPSLVHGGDLTFTQDLVANFDFDVLGGTPINPGPATGFQPYEAFGALTFTLDSSINDPTQTTVPFTNVTGTLNGVYPTSLLPYTISPDVQFIGGDLTNIVRDGSGNVISGNVSDLSMRWDLIAFGGALTLFTLDGLPFDGSITSIPFSNYTVLSGPAQFNVYMDFGGTDLLVAYGENRTLTTVPEPTSATLAGLAALTLGAVIARRRRNSKS
jgi:MYXO-CTERM domain-containing protein